MIILCVDDCCVFGTSKEKINEFTESLKRPKDEKSKKNYEHEDGGFDFITLKSIEKFLGVEVSQSESTITLRQQLLIECIITVIGFQDKQVHLKPTPSTEILYKDEYGKERKEQWNHRSLAGMLNYLVNSTRPDAMMAMHQCARFYENPKLSHEKAFKCIVKHSLGTRHIGMHTNVNVELGLIAFADSDFENGWNKLNPDDKSSIFSRSG